MMKRVTAALLFAIFLTGCQPSATPLPSEPTQTIQPTPAATATDTPGPTLTSTAAPIPTQTNTPYPAVDEQIAAGDNHTCLLHTNGTVSCWGWNQYGQSGQSINQTVVTESPVNRLEGITRISAGAYHTCALDQSGQVWCWGRNNDGQLGNGSDQDSAVPTRVAGFSGRSIRTISAGSMHTCAIDYQGSVWCWGSNRMGKLGQPADVFSYSTPQQVTALSTAAEQIAAGSSHTCAVDTHRDLWCWGEGIFGQVGLNPFASSAAPVRISTLTEKIVSMQAGWFHTCLLTESGRVLCWGKNQDGQLGNAAQISRADPVSPVKMDNGVSLLASGGQSNCSIAADQITYCWGRNNYGQIGDQTSTDRLIPIAVKLPIVPTQITVGGSHVCALDGAGQVYCWGANDVGQLGTYQINAIPTATMTVRVPTQQP